LLLGQELEPLHKTFNCSAVRNRAVGLFCTIDPLRAPMTAISVSVWPPDVQAGACRGHD